MESAFKMKLRKRDEPSKKGPLKAKHPAPTISSQINTGHNKELRSPVGQGSPILVFHRRRQPSPDLRVSRRNARGSPKESPKTSPTRHLRERSNSPSNTYRRPGVPNRYNRTGARTPPSPNVKRYTPPTSPRVRRKSPTRGPQSSPILTKSSRVTPLKCLPNPAIPSLPSPVKTENKPPSPASSRPPSPGNRRPPSPRGTSPRGRGASPGSKPPPISEEDLQIRVQRAHKARLYLLPQPGPNSFSVGSDAPNHKYKVIIGPQTCSCGHGPYCIHVLFVMVRVLQLPDNDPLLIAGSLKDYEVEQLLRNWEDRRKKAIHAHDRRTGLGYKKENFLSRTNSRKGRSPPGSPTMPSRHLHDNNSDIDAQCPICLMNMVAGEHLVSCDASCQNFFHHHCMSIWAADRQAQNQPLLCPLCRSPWSSKFSQRLNAINRERKSSFFTTSPTSTVRRNFSEMSSSFSGKTSDSAHRSRSSSAMSRSLLDYTPQQRSQVPKYSRKVDSSLPYRHRTELCLPVTDEVVPLPRSEPIPENVESEAAGWIEVFGTELIKCLYSRDWAIRETGIRRLAHEIRKVLNFDYFGSTEEKRKSVITCSLHILTHVANDPVYKVYIACLRCTKLLLTNLSPTQESEVQELQQLLRPLIDTVVSKCSDGNRRTSQMSIEFILELAKGQQGELALAIKTDDISGVKGLGDMSYVLSCLLDGSSPSEIPWHDLLGRLHVLDRLLDKFTAEFQLTTDDSADKLHKIKNYKRLMTVVEFACQALGSNHATVSKLARKIYVCSARMAILQPSVFNQICGMLGKLDASLQTRLRRRLINMHSHGERKGSLTLLSDKLYNSQDSRSSNRLVRSISDSPSSRMLSSLRSNPQTDLFQNMPEDSEEKSSCQSDEKPAPPKRPTLLPLNCFDLIFKEKQAKLRLYHKNRTKQEVPLLVQHALLSPGAKPHQFDMHQLNSILKGEDYCRTLGSNLDSLTPMEYTSGNLIKEAIGTPPTPNAPYTTPVKDIVPDHHRNFQFDSEADETLSPIPGLDLIPKYLQEDMRTNDQMYEPTYEEGRHWSKGPLLGTGAFSSCYQGRDFHTGTLMAVKQLSVTRNSEEEQEKVEAAIEDEILMMSKLKHPNIVRLFGATRFNSTFSLFTEWMAGGSVAGMLDKYGPFSETVIIKYTRQVLLGLQYLHDNTILHRDLKGANLLIDSTGQTLRIGDFGTATRLANKSTITGEFQGQLLGTIAFMAPEVLKGEDYGRACDVWSVGCCIIEMATTKPPWGADHISNQYKLMFRIASSGAPPPIPQSLSHETQEIATKCLQIASVMRPSAKALLKLPVFNMNLEAD